MDKIKINSCNVRGLAERKKRRQIFVQLHENSGDIILMQETHCIKSQEKIWKSEWGGRILFAHGTSNARGVAILFAKNLDIEIKKVKKSDDGRYLLVSAVISNHPLLLCNIYAPNEDAPEFFANLFNEIQQFDISDKIVGGDLNILLDPALDRKSLRKDRVVPAPSQASVLINQFLEDEGWCDVWRILHPNTFSYTWKRAKPLVMSRLDYVIMPQSTFGLVESCTIKSNCFSDHLFLEVILQLSDTLRGPGYWKLNTSLLEDKEFLDNINRIIYTAENRDKHVDPGLRWENLKSDIIEHAKFWGRMKAGTSKIKKRELEDRLQKLERRLNFINLKSDDAIRKIEKLNPKIDQCKQELAMMKQKQIEGVILRSKAR